MHKLYLLVLAFVAAVALAGPAYAAPANDDIANATVITGLPYDDSTDTTEATWTNTEGGCGVSGHTIWYVWTPLQDATVSINVATSGFTPSLTLWYGGYPPAANPVCGFPYPGQLTYRVEAGETYYLQVATLFSWESGGSVQITIDEVPPPANDDFAEAHVFTAVPFADSPDLIAATTEPGEPMACDTNFGQSTWYAFTPTTSGSYGGDPGVSAVNVYTGSSLGDLTSVACSQWWGLAFHAEAGTTYYLQVYGGGMRIDLLRPPAIEYVLSPGDPSTFDDISFYQVYWDPSVTTLDWDFGDGTTGAGQNVSHRFAADGDYSVMLTGTTVDGRTNSQTQAVQVRTHDVTILSLVAPGKGKVGKTGVMTVGLGNTHYPETVQIDLYKITPQGNVLIDTKIQAVGVMKLKKAAYFSFNYTFTNDDLAVGKVPFQAVATIQGARDALSGDNAATSPPTLVTR